VRRRARLRERDVPLPRLPAHPRTLRRSRHHKRHDRRHRDRLGQKQKKKQSNQSEEPEHVSGFRGVSIPQGVFLILSLSSPYGMRESDGGREQRAITHGKRPNNKKKRQSTVNMHASATAPPVPPSRASPCRRHHRVRRTWPHPARGSPTRPGT
jgi:hypothetical protein